ncbi:FecR family protein [Adhaeribacter pallidiroseus]|uniref:Uncharacterized protein n=1 Tax=Adhaeribacter pallidiroseus TaxID=2072847 RepID=A0A369QKS9_9BACT|nr:FecR domain-containing protein [Adhaeribacter pallidiroseus]RDC64940.1 hypothetical protein AHMF7616_03562 [Adhaeribacter pallidiroseus]
MKPAIQDLIQKYLQGQATAEEQVLVEQYYNSFSNQRNYTETLSPRDKKLLEEKILTRILTKVQSAPETQPATLVKPIKVSLNNYLKVAAIFVGLVALAISYKYFLASDKVVLTTHFGEVATFTLPDSSRVTLNGNSVLEYTTWNKIQDREVTLQGEAFFSVKHTQNHQKFLVHVPGKMEVEVLGTEFNVLGRQHNSRVVLSSGKVQLHLPASNTSAQTVVMQPGEMVELKPQTAHVIKTKVNPEKYTSWSGRMLVLEQTSLRDLIQDLEDTYGLQVTVNDTSLLSHTFSGRLPSQDVEVLLLGLSKAFDLKITKTNNQVTIIK